MNQFECHPQWQQPELCEYCQRRGIHVVAYASLGCGELLCEEAVLRVSQESGLRPAQVLLVWALQKGYAVIPKSVHPEYIRQFSPGQLLNLRLGDRQMSALDALVSILESTVGIRRGYCNKVFLASGSCVTRTAQSGCAKHSS